MATEIEKSSSLKTIVDRSVSLHEKLQNYSQLPAYQTLEPALGFLSNTMDTVYRVVVILAFQTSIHPTYTGIITENNNQRFLSRAEFEIGANILNECRSINNSEELFDIVCIAQKFAVLSPDSPTYIATEPALRQRFTEEIRTLIGDTTEPYNFFGKYINSLRLSDIYDKLSRMVNRDLPNMISLIDRHKFYEIEEPFRLQWLDLKFAELRTDLHANESQETIDAKLSEYRIAIQNAFGVTFHAESTASEWVLASIHYVRLGLSATARAFRNWVDNNNNKTERIINQFHIFHRTMGAMEFWNRAEIRTTKAAQTNQRQIGASIDVYRRNAERQWIMSPNNFIHELGHAFDGRAGLSTKLLGSMDYTASLAGRPTTRESMGPAYLRPTDLFYDHAHVKDENPTDGTAEFEPFVYPTTFDETGYLLFDIFGYNYALWNSNYNIYRLAVGSFNARIDTFVHNYTATHTETVADAFLSWVRNSFLNELGEAGPEDDENEKDNWENFFTNNMGMFLRNAALYTLGSVEYYKSIQVIQQNPVQTGSKSTQDLRLRSKPIAGEGTEEYVIGGSFSDLDSSIEIYGWQNTSPATDQNYWLLVRTLDDQIWWVADGAVVHDETLITGNEAEDIAPAPEINPNLIIPDREFTSNEILDEFVIITGF